MAFRFDWARCSLSSPILSATPRTLRLIGQTCLVQALVLVLFNIGQGLLLPAQLWVGKEIVDKAVSLIRQTGSQFSGLLLFLVGLRLLIMQAGRILEAWSQLVQTRAGFLLTRKVTHLVMNKAVSLELAHFDSADYYNKVELARREAGTRPLWMLQTLVDFIRVGIQSAGTVVLLSQFSWVAVVVTVVASAPGFIYELMFAKQNWSFTTENVPQVRAMNYLSRVLTTKEAAKEIRLFGLADYFIDKYHKIFSGFLNEIKLLALRKNRVGMVMALIHSIGVVGVYAATFLAALLGRITIGAMLMYKDAANVLYNQVQWYVHLSSQFAENSFYLHNLFDFLEGDMAHSVEINSQKHDVMPSDYELRIEDVSFKYPGSDRYVLRDVTFTVKPGERVALVGKNGAGKTTLIKLILGLYQPSGGRILLGGTDLREFTRESLTRAFAVCFQDYCNYSFSAAESIALGDVNFAENLDRIGSAARQSGADEVIQALPHGYDTYLGREFDEDGVPLSGGQQQKVALARTFIRDEAESKILILDEPTAALDPEAEYQVYQRFEELTRGRSAIMITHRLGSVTMADKIVFLEDGRVTEMGSHQDLMALGGNYARLFALQADRFRIMERLPNLKS